MLDELTAIVDGYNSYFSFSKVKSGYSGKIFVAAVFLVQLLLVHLQMSKESKLVVAICYPADYSKYSGIIRRLHLY